MYGVTNKSQSNLFSSICDLKAIRVLLKEVIKEVTVWVRISAVDLDVWDY